ncbi:hypothetical protein FQN54_004248 [Arachnomyces sp. PD_36]|nr:hypothetical protein FQN54_004248 [Arachnomyces sp. PD_36]
MGQKQSSSSKGGADSGQNEAQTDYYQLLGLDQSATEDEIKKAYRRKALELHPDRNYGNTETSTALFAEVQSAYEVLSDPQERAWYDSHRDVILRGGDPSQGDQYSYDLRMTTTDDIMKLFMKFSPQMDFSDAPSGFYGGLRETFDQLAREEDVTCQRENLDPIDYPSFGSRDDDYDDVVRPFYAAWNGFATKKSFAWKDVHRYSEAPDRRIRRLMEKENKRLREEAVREFNDAVRSLVAFARKRDPRCKANAQSEAERQKSLRDAAAAQAARSRAANEARLKPHTVQEWARTEDQEELSSESESEPEKVHFECVVCRKLFKSDKQFEAHERSKKHLKAVKQLRWEMRAQDKELDLDEARSSGFPSDNVPNEEELPSAEISDDEPGGARDINTSSGAAPAHAGSHDEHSGDELGSHTNSEDQHGVGAVKDEGNDSIPPRPSHTGASASITEDDNPGPVASEPLDSITEKLSTISVEQSDTSTPKIGKAKQKRAKRAAAQNAPKEFKCITCGSTFPSNSQLFSHIKELDHAQPVSKPVKASGKKRR